VNRYEIEICDLESWGAQIAAIYEKAEDLQSADGIKQLVDCRVTDVRRIVEGRDGTLADLAETKRGIRLAGSLLDSLQQSEAKGMQGWRWRARPTNVVQSIYEIIYDIAMSLGRSIAAIEGEFPHLAAQFDSERRAYKDSLESFKSETANSY
jgi:hypothetical protein